MAVQAAASDRRVHRRYQSIDASCMIDGKEYSLFDLSMGGFCAKNYDGEMIVKQKFQFVLRFPVNGRMVKVPCMGIVAWIRDDMLGGMFVKPRGEAYDLLASYLKSL